MVEIRNNRIAKKYDLEERTSRFGENMINFLKKLPINTLSLPVINQLMKSSTSIGANYCEADDAESKRDFRHKIGIVKKECRETKFFLRMLISLFPNEVVEISKLKNEAKELNLIFNKIYQKVST